MMQTEQSTHKSLELKVFAFSINVISFVKSLEKSGKANAVTKHLLHLANEFYTCYLVAEESMGKYNKTCYLEDSKQKGEKCLELLQSIEVEKALLNEKVDLIIEVAELIKKIPVHGIS